MVDDRVEGTLLVIGRPPPLNPGMWLGGHMVFQHLHRLAAEHHHLPQPRFGLLPALMHERHFLCPTHQWGQVGWADGVEAALCTTLAQDAIDMHRRGHASEVCRSQVFNGKVPLHELEGDRTDHQRIRRREPLNTGGHIGCFA